MVVLININEVIRLNLKRILNERNLSPLDFSKIINKPASQISNWLSDPRKAKSSKPIARKLINEICEKGNINTAELFDFGVVGYKPKKLKTKNDKYYLEYLHYKEKYLNIYEENQKLKKLISKHYKKNGKRKFDKDTNLLKKKSLI